MRAIINDKNGLAKAEYEVLDYKVETPLYCTEAPTISLVMPDGNLVSLTSEGGTEMVVKNAAGEQVSHYTF